MNPFGPADHIGPSAVLLREEEAVLLKKALVRAMAPPMLFIGIIVLLVEGIMGMRHYLCYYPH